MTTPLSSSFFKWRLVLAPGHRLESTRTKIPGRICWYLYPLHLMLTSFTTPVSTFLNLVVYFLYTQKVYCYWCTMSILECPCKLISLGMVMTFLLSSVATELLGFVPVCVVDVLSLVHLRRVSLYCVHLLQSDYEVSVVFVEVC